jgi:hypothetical protein
VPVATPGFDEVAEADDDALPPLLLVALDVNVPTGDAFIRR